MDEQGEWCKQPGVDPPMTNLERFCAWVLATPALRERFMMIDDTACFVHEVVAVGRVHGFQFTDAEVEWAMRESHLVWLERWL